MAPAEPDMYQEWLARKYVQPEPAMEQLQVADQFSTGNPETMDLMQVKSQFSTGNAPAPTTDWSGVAGAGITAAGQAAGSVAQIAARKAAQDTAMASSAAGRASTEAMERARLAQSASMFNDNANASAYDMLLRAFSNSVSNTADQRDLKRGITRSASDAMSTAFLGR
jgi:hypothetical protein